MITPVSPEMGHTDIGSVYRFFANLQTIGGPALLANSSAVHPPTSLINNWYIVRYTGEVKTKKDRRHQQNIFHKGTGMFIRYLVTIPEWLSAGMAFKTFMIGFTVDRHIWIPTL